MQPKKSTPMKSALMGVDFFGVDFLGRGLHQTTLLRTNSVSLLPVSSPGLSKASARYRIYGYAPDTEYCVVLCFRAGTGTGRVRARGRRRAG